MQVNSYPVVVHCSTDSYPLIVGEQSTGPCECQKPQQAACCQQKKVSAAGDLNLSTVIQATMAMMAVIIAICTYQACSEGAFGCEVNSWPDISHVMGRAPYNKLYSIMFAIYSCTK